MIRSRLPRCSTGASAELLPWLILYVAACGVFVGMEWLFFVTKPSFLNVFAWTGRVRVFGAALFPLCAVGVLAIAVLVPVTRIRVWPVQFASRLCIRAMPTVVLSASVLLLVDNFTTTLLGWGIESLRAARVAYAAAVVVAVALVWWHVGRWAAALRSRPQVRRIGLAVAGALLAVGATGAVSELMTGRALVRPAPGRPSTRPNVLLVGIDGVNADHLPIYGYHRETAPSLTALARNALVFTRAYSNAANTGGALTAILTGRLPTETRVIFAPDILRGDSSVLHLPALLRAVGYRTGQFAVRHYAASVDYNLRGGFDVVNGQDTRSGLVSSPFLLPWGSGGYLLGRILDRVASRVSHLAGHRERTAFAEVTESMAAQYMDAARLRQLQAFLASAPEPWFAHIHLLGTHGARFAPRTRHFSAGQSQVSDWMTDFYDDAILDADQSIAEVLARLRGRGVFDRTLVVVYSDHGQRSRTERAVPLLVRLPNGSGRRRIDAAVQTIDIAPTILAALGLRAPEWMTGASLLGEIPPCRRVFASIAGDRAHFRRADYTIPTPPFYSLGAVSLVHGKQWFILELQRPTPVLTHGVDQRAVAVGSCAPLTRSEAQSTMLHHLRATGYDFPPSYPGGG